MNGRAYEAVRARIEGRPRQDLYHTALDVRLAGERYAIENAWPCPDANTASRGVVRVGPVFHRRLARIRPFRYEVRCWRDGIIPDAGEAVGGPRHLSADHGQARRLLDLAATVPALTWGRDELGAGEMWNSNSVIAWLLARSGVPLGDVAPPPGGRAPGWAAGLAAAADARRWAG